MPLPIDLVVVRHGESESNLANRRDRSGDQALMTKEHLNRHSSEFRLTDTGIAQAKFAGEWIRSNFTGEFDFCITSAFMRAMETAAHLNLPNAKWAIDPYLVERDHGDMDGLSHDEKIESFGEDYQERYIQHFYRRPPNGESRLDLGLRWDRMMTSLAERHHEHRVILVAHQSIIEAGVIRRLHWTVEEFHHWKKEKDPATKINNCQIIHFTRRDPVTGRINERVRWWRTVCPWDLKSTSDKWRPVVPKQYSSEDLLEMVEGYERIIIG